MAQTLFDLQTALALAEDMQRRGKRPSDLNPKGQALLSQLSVHLRQQGYASYQEYIARQQPTIPAATPSLAERAAGAVTGAVAKVERAPERAISGLGGAKDYPELYRKAGIPEALAGEWSPLTVVARLATSPIAWATGGIGAGLRAVRPAVTGTQAVVRRGVAMPATQLAGRTLTPAQAQAERLAMAAEEAATIRPGQPALPAPGGTYRPPLVTPAPIPGEVSGMAAQRLGNVGAGILPPSLRTPALPAGVTQRPPPPIFSRARLVPQEPPPPPVSPTAVPPPAQVQQTIFPVGGPTTPQAVHQGRTRTAILNRVFGGGFGDKLADAETVERSIMGPPRADLRATGFTKMTAAEDRNLRQVLGGRAQPITQKVQEWARRIRQMFTEADQEYSTLGARVLQSPTIRDPQTGEVVKKAVWKPYQGLGSNYVPRFVDPKGVLKTDPKQFAKDVMIENPGMSLKDATDVVTVLRDRALGVPSPQGIKQEIITLVKRDAFLPAHLHSRTGLNLPDYVYRSMKETVDFYIEQSARERAFLRVFGANADEVVEQRLTQLGGRSNPHVALGEEVWDLYRGRFVEAESDRRLKQIGRTLNSIASTLLLGVQTAVQQPSQYMNLIGQFGGRNVARGFARVIQQGGVAEAERAGTFVRSLVDELALLDRLSPTATKADVAEKVAAHLARTNVRLSGIQFMDEFPRAVGFHAAKAWLHDLQRAATLGNQRAIKELAKVRLTPAATLDEIVAKAADLSAKYNITTGFADMPHILSTPIGTFARGLQTFMIQQSRQSAQFLLRAARGEVVPLIRYLTVAQPIGEGIGTAVRFLQGRSGDRPGGPAGEFYADLAAGRVPTNTVIKRAADNYGWAATFGLAQRLIEFGAGAMGIEATGQSRKMSGTEFGARAIGMAAGAGVSSGIELAAGVPLELGAAALAPDEAARARHLKTAGRIATRRIPGVGGIVSPRLFRSEYADRRMATEAMARAWRRGDREAAAKIQRDFMQQYPGKSISMEAFEKALGR